MACEEKKLKTGSNLIKMYLFYKSCIEQSSFNPFKTFKMPNIDVVFVQDLMLNMAAFGKENVLFIATNNKTVHTERPLNVNKLRLHCTCRFAHTPCRHIRLLIFLISMHLLVLFLSLLFPNCYAILF